MRCKSGRGDCLPAKLVEQPTGAVRANEGKVRFELITPEPLRELAKVLTRGAVKYEARNWERGLTYSSTWACLNRHLWSWYEGEDQDPESGLHHLTHALCNVWFLLTFAKRIEAGTLPATLDDRPKR
jgi:Domain of unknown function (DUF5664)